MKEHIVNICRLLHSIYSLGEIEAIEIANCKCLPLLLEFMLPIDLKNGQVLSVIRNPM